MKAWLTLGLGLLASTSFAQSASVLSDLGDIYKSFQRTLVPNPFLVSPQQSNPFDMSPLPAVPSKYPGSAIIPKEDPKKIRLVHGTTSHSTETGITSIRDDAEIYFRGYRMQASNIDWNPTSAVFILRGDAVLTGDGAVVKARKILVDTKNRSYEAYDSDSDLKPSLVGGLLLSDVYVKGVHTTGTEHRAFVDIGRLTTCRYEVPHYELDAKRIDARFERRLILRDVTLIILQRPIFKLPFLVIPLDNRSYQNLPSVGSDPIEGYYIKTHYGIPLPGDQTLYSRLDYMTRLGLGIGGDYFYNHESKFNAFKGQISVYDVTGARSFQLQQSQSGNVGRLTYQIDNSYDNHNYLTSPTSVIESTRATFGLVNKFGTSGLSYSRNDNSATGFDSQQQSVGFTNTEAWHNGMSTNVQLTYNDAATSFTGSSSGTNNTRQTLDVNLRAQDDFRSASAILEYQRSIPIGSIQNFLNSTDRTPNVTIQTDSRKLFGNEFGTEIPFKASLSVGQFGTPIAGSNVTRNFFNLTFDKASDPNARARFDLNGLFSQGIYSDNTAEYVLGLGGSMSYRLGSDTSFNVHYNYLKPEGYSPLGIDQSGRQNVVTEDLSFRPERSVLFGLQSGYDALQPEQGLTAWQPLSLRAEYTPSKDILFRNQATYDPFIKNWANYRYDFSYKHGATYLGLGGWYDNTRHIWTQTNLFVNALTIGRTKIDLRANYNGYSKQFDQRQIAFSYDLHDAELVFQIINNAVGYNNGTQFVFFLRLKAFPFDTNFGTGNRGQAIGTGTGIGY